MSKKISRAFFLLIVVTIISLSDYLRLPRNIIGLFTNFSPQGFALGIVNVVKTLLPPAMLVLLCMNEKKNVKKVANIVLIVGGLVYLGGFLLGAKGLVGSLGSSDIFVVLRGVFPRVNAVITGIVLILAALNLKNRKQDHVVMVIAAVTLFINLVYIASILISKGNILSAMVPVLFVIALAYFPRAIYNPENCEAADSNFFIAAGVVVAIFVFCMLAANYAVNSDSSAENSTQECFNCGGDGWDSDNNGVCVWCGGDGKSSWNP